MREPKILNRDAIYLVEARRIPFDGAASTGTIDDLIATIHALFDKIEALEDEITQLQDN